MVYFTQENYETLREEIRRRSENSKIWEGGRGKRKTRYKSKNMALTLEECEKYCKIYLSNDMKKLKFIIQQIINNQNTKKEKFDSREKYELSDLGYEVFVLSLGMYDPESNCSFDTFLSGNITRKFYTYGRDRTRRSRCNWEPKWDYENNCYKKNEKGEIEKKPVFDISMFSKVKNGDDGMELWETFEGGGDFVDNLIEHHTENNVEEYSREMQRYLRTLSDVQIEVLRMTSNGFLKEEIIEILDIPVELYNDSIAAIKNPKNTRLLRRGE